MSKAIDEAQSEIVGNGGYKMNRIIMYAHDGSSNHGCEAIARTTINILGTKECTIYSRNRKADIKYLPDLNLDILQVNNIDKYSAYAIYSKIARKFFKNWGPETRYMYNKLLKEKDKIILSIGGDNYCYSFPGSLIYLNNKLSKNNKTILWGCSITPKLLEDKRIRDDMLRYSLITARESITYDALMNAGVNKNTKLYPDPAFTLKTEEIQLPDGFKEDGTIGLNISPLIQRLENKDDIIYKNYSNLMDYIIKNTNFNIALVPHVVKEGNNDLEPISRLYKEYKSTGRVVLIQDNNCMALKGYISKCRMFIAARTHASIAAYSTFVPTLVVGYSVKAKGIAKDIFGTYEDYVLPVQSLVDECALVESFKWLNKHEQEIKFHLRNFMPSYIEKAWKAGDEVRKLIGDMKNELSK